MDEEIKRLKATIGMLQTQLLETQFDVNYWKGRAEFFEERNREILEIKKADDTIK